MLAYLIQDELLVLSPLEHLIFGVKLGPITPVKNENGHCWLAIVERRVKALLDKADGLVALTALFSWSGTLAWQIIRLDPVEGPRIVVTILVVLPNVRFYAQINYFGQFGMRRLFRADKIDYSVRLKSSQRLNCVMRRPNHVEGRRRICSLHRYI